MCLAEKGAISAETFLGGLLNKMGNYIYLSCKTCNEYIHIGKTSGSDFEVSFDLLKRFLMKHTIRKGCILTTLDDSIDHAEYDFVMQGVEFEDK